MAEKTGGIETTFDIKGEIYIFSIGAWVLIPTKAEVEPGLSTSPLSFDILNCIKFPFASPCLSLYSHCSINREIFAL